MFTPYLEMIIVVLHWGCIDNDVHGVAVEETCTMGCQGLDYCTNFNNRPTELFRSCNRMADEGARKEVAMWTETGAITLPEFQDFKIPIKGE